VNSDEKASPERNTKVKKLPVIKAVHHTCDDQEANDELNTTKETPKLVPSSSLLNATLQNSSIQLPMQEEEIS
jgi:hypothetical protein